MVAFEAIGPVPFACSWLADMGASVLTVTRPTSSSALPGGLVGTSTESGPKVGIDLKQPDGVEAVLQLLAHADVLIEGFRPGVLERLGLGPEDVAARNDRLVYARVTGWGQDGPYAPMAGHDINYIALTGVLEAIGTENQPIPPLNLVGDYGGGSMFAVAGILAALVERASTGRGRVVDVAMVDGASTLLGPIRALAQAGVWRESRQANLLDGGAPFYRTYRTSDDRFVAVGALEPEFYSQLVSGLGLVESELPNRFDQDNWDDLSDRFALAFASRTRDEWQEVFDGTDACVTPVLSMGEVMDHPHNAQRGALVGIEGSQRPTPAPRFADASDDPTSRDGGSASVASSDDTRAALEAWGMAAGDVDRLMGQGIITEG